MPELISPRQGGVVQGRYITENIALANELCYSLKNKVRQGNVILKIEIAKAFDRVNWSLLLGL